MELTKYVHIAYIATTPKKLWQALTNAEFTKQYFFGRQVESEWHEGASVTFTTEDGELDVHGVITECESPRLLTYTWQVAKDNTVRDQPVTVTFSIEPWDNLVKFIISCHNLLPGDLIDDTSTFVGFNNGWPAIVSSLKTLLETGKALDIKAPKYQPA